MQSIPSVGIAFRRPSGIIAGLTSAWAIFGFILAIDSELNLPPGTFYRMIGVALGIGSLYGLGGSFSPTELWNSATNVEQYAEYIEYYIF
jgi:hypothetical protein